MFEQVVAKGSAWLDEAAPGWWKKIDIKTLGLSDYSRCTLGQTFGVVASKNLCMDGAFSIPHGFMVSGVHIVDPIVVSSFWGKKTVANEAEVKEAKRRYDNAYAELTGVWIREILRRRAADRMQSEALEKAGVNGGHE